MKLNKKGYMLVEIIVSFALTFAIMISMINLVLSFKNKNEDIYYEAKYLKDKNLITRNIMDDLSNTFVTEINCNDQSCRLRTINDDIKQEESPQEDELLIEISKDTDRTIIKYTLYENEIEKFYYEKALEPSLQVGKMQQKDEYGIFHLTIPISSIYTDKSYDINLVAKRIY